MSTQLRRTVAAALFLVVAGLIRAPVEQKMTATLRQDGLLQPPLDVATTKKLGQGFWAVSLGGLRTLVGTILSLRAQTFFEKYYWEGVADTYDTIVQLVPDSEFYWDTGAWHLSKNAVSYYRNNYEHLPADRVHAEQKYWFGRGIDFLEEGLKHHPDSARLWHQLGVRYSEPFSFQKNYRRAAHAFRMASQSPRALPYMRRFVAYCMVRDPDQIDDALPYVEELRHEPGGSVPTLVCVHFTLLMRQDPSRDGLPLAERMFGSDREAYQQLGRHFLDLDDDYPMNGVAETLRALEEKLGVPEAKSVFNAREFLQRQRFSDLMEENPDRDGMALARSMFGGPDEAYRQLSRYFLDHRGQYIVKGVTETLRRLEERLSVPEEKSVFSNLAPLAPSNP
ncbi:hypothetical protein [Haloferula sargassicola]|uniref:DUF4034 domain-containing protein n=1 Tax=Haloferula sargassicola TaxID=490096 RepID=A0ABP9UN97_9BACT